jgi:hypothetical protein
MSIFHTYQASPSTRPLTAKQIKRIQPFTNQVTVHELQAMVPGPDPRLTHTFPTNPPFSIGDAFYTVGGVGSEAPVTCGGAGAGIVFALRAIPMLLAYSPFLPVNVFELRMSCTCNTICRRRPYTPAPTLHITNPGINRTGIRRLEVAGVL